MYRLAAEKGPRIQICNKMIYQNRMHFVFLRNAEGVHASDAAVRGPDAYFDPANKDAPLDASGQQQTIDNKRDYACDAIYCSPMMRSYTTLVQVMPGAQDRPVQLDDRLLEPQGGAISSMRSEKAELLATVSAAWDTTGVADQNPFSLVVEQQSTDPLIMTELQERIRSFMADLAVKYTDSQTVVVVSHCDWINTWFWLYSGAGVIPGNCETLLFDVSKNLNSEFSTVNGTVG